MAIFYTDSGSFNNVTVSGSTVVSASKGIALQVQSSGSVIFSVSGSQGEIFNISDIATSTALFTVASGSTNILNIDNTKTVSVSGSLVITGSTTQVGNNNLFGNTTLSGSIIISGSTVTPTVQVYGNVTHDGYIRFNPVSTNINQSISASYIYVSGSTNDLYFTQNGQGYSNTTRLRWLEGNLYTGLLHGGLITTQSSTVYQVGSGSGIIVNLNASIPTDPYPTIQFLSWPNLSSSIAPLSASYDQQFVSINSSGQIFAQGIPYTDGDFNDKITIGVVLHQNRSTINAIQTFPTVGYGWKQRSNDFIRAFGPLKISGYTLAPSGSSTGSLILDGGVSYVDGRNYIVDPNNPSYIVEATGITTSKIFRYYQSGSNGWVYDTNVGAGYGAIDPANYSLNGVLTPVSITNWTIQRVYYFPNSATKALYIYYGNAQYSSKDNAIAGILTETFNEAPNTAANAIFVGYMLLRQNANFTNSTTYEFRQAGLFRGSGAGTGGGGGTGATALTGLTDVNISSPTNGQPLVYDTTSTKWINSSALTASLFGTASYVSGSIFTSTNLALSASYALTSSTAITASYALTASSAQNAQDILIYVKNVSGAQIDKGKVVRISGATGDNALISTASYENDNNSANTLGITTQNIANDSFGYVITEGTLLGIDTDAFTAGQLLYLGTTGSIIGTAPVAPLHGVRLGQVLRVQQNNGSMYVRIDNGYEIGELHDVVDTTTTSSYGDLLVKSGSVWTNSKQLTGSYSLTGSLTVSGSSTFTNIGPAVFSGSVDISGSSIIIGALAVGTSSLGSTENTLVVGPPPSGVGLTGGEGGQILLQAPMSGTYTTASMIDNYQNTFRILRGTNASSDASLFNLNLHTYAITTAGTVNGATATEMGYLNGVTSNIQTQINNTSDTVLNAYQALGSSVKAQAMGISMTNITTTVTMLSGAQSFLRVIPVYLQSTQTLNGVLWYQAASGSYTAINENRVALYSYSAGTASLVASSSNDPNIWSGSYLAAQQAFVTKSFSSPFVASPGIYYIGILAASSATTTSPTMGAAANINVVNVGLRQLDFTNGALSYGIRATVTALPGSFIVGTYLNSATQNIPFAAVY